MKTKNNRKKENHKKQKAQKENRKQKTENNINNLRRNQPPQIRHQVRTSSFPRNDVSPKNRAKEVDGDSEGISTPGALDTFKGTAMFFNTKPEKEVRSRDAMVG